MVAIQTDQESLLLAAVLADPADDLVRLAYADWLEEHARTDRVPCPRCSPYADVPCPECDGRGWAWDEAYPGDDTRRHCPTCQGGKTFPRGYHPARDPASGREEGGWTNCKTCNGGGKRSVGEGVVEHCDGRAARAEFIRVQVELARLPVPPELTIGLVGEAWPEARERELCPDCRASRRGPRRPLTPCRYHELRRREDVLFDAAWLPHVGGQLRQWSLSPPLPRDQSHPFAFTVRRGFVEGVRCSLDHWDDHGHEIVREHPVARVELTDRRPRVTNGGVGWWRHEDDGDSSAPWEDLPRPLWGALPRSTAFFDEPAGPGRWKWYASEAAALDALSDALLLVAGSPRNGRDVP